MAGQRHQGLGTALVSRPKKADPWINPNRTGSVLFAYGFNFVRKNEPQSEGGKYGSTVSPFLFSIFLRTPFVGYFYTSERAFELGFEMFEIHILFVLSFLSKLESFGFCFCYLFVGHL